MVQNLEANKGDLSCVNNVGMTPCHTSVMNGQNVIVRYIIKQKGAFDKKSNNGMTPLHLASQCGFFVIVKTLIDAGADVSATTKDGQTAKDIALDDKTAACFE